MNGETIGAVVQAVFGQIIFHLLAGWCLTDREQVEHKFGDRVRRTRVPRLDMRWIESNADIIAVAMFLTKRLRELFQIEPVPEKMIEHRHAGSIAILHDDDGHSGRRHPRDEPIEMGKPFLRRNVIERMRTKHEIPLRLWISGENRRADGFGLWDGLFELCQQMRVRFDGDCMTKGAGEGLGHLSVSGAGIDKNFSVRQAIDEFLEKTFGVPLLIRVIEKGLERPLVSLALRVENLYRI